MKDCGCPKCTAEYRPGQKPTRKSCTGPWQARYRDPAGHQRAKQFDSEAQAIAFLDNMRDAVRAGTYVAPERGELTLAEWHAQWWPTRRGSETTLQRSDSAWINHVEPHFGSWPLIAIGHLDVQAWIARVLKKTGVHSLIKAFRLLDGMLAAAVLDRRIPHNPADGIKLPTPPAKHPDDLMPPSYDQLADVRSHIPEHYHPLLIVAEESGLRWGELVGLRRCHVDFKAMTIQVREVVIEVHGKPKRKKYPKSNAGFRTVPLTDRAAHALKEHLRVNPAATTRTAPSSGMHPEELVFRGPKAGKKTRAGVEFEGVLKRNNFRRLWVPAIQEAGIARQVEDEVTGRTEWWPHVHDVRHAFASRLHDQGVSEANAQKILGHERGGKITWIYTHASAGAVDEVRAALEPGAGLRVVSSESA